MSWNEKSDMTPPLTYPQPALTNISSDEKTTLAAAAGRGGSCFSGTSNNSWDTEKGVLGREMRDDEELVTAAAPSPRHMTEIRHNGQPRSSATPSREQIVRYYDEHDDYETSEASRRLESKAFNILLYLSAPVVGVSVFCTVWTILSVVVIILTYPIRRLLQRDITLGEVLNAQSISTMNIQLSCIYSAKLNNSDMSLAASWFIHLLSPVFAFALMLWAWVAAFYWAGSAIVNNPQGPEGSNDDGRELILSTRRWWRSWLLMGLTH